MADTPITDQPSSRPTLTTHHSVNLALSHGTDDYRPEAARRAANVYRRASNAVTLRSKAEIAALLDGYELLEPGVVDMIRWRPEVGGRLPDPLGGDVTRYSMYAAVGRRPVGAQAAGG